MNTLPERVLCVTLGLDGPAAQIGLVEGRLRYLGGWPESHAAVAAVLEALAEGGVKVRVERLGLHTIDVDFVEMSAEHPRYLGAVAKSFRERGWWAQTLERDRAVMWRDLVRLPIDRETKEDLMHRLTFLEGEALEDLRAILSGAVRELEHAGK